MARDEPKIFELKPAKTIAEAVSNARAHVSAVNQSAGTTGGGGGNGGSGGGRGKGKDK